MITVFFISSYDVLSFAVRNKTMVAFCCLPRKLLIGAISDLTVKNLVRFPWQISLASILNVNPNLQQVPLSTYWKVILNSLRP